MRPTPLAAAVPGGEARVDEVSPTGSLAGPLTQPVPSAPEVVIELSNKDKPEDSALPTAFVPTAPVSTAAPTSIASTIYDIPGPSSLGTVGWLDTSCDKEIARRLFVELNHDDDGDGGLVIQSSDDEDESAEEEEVDEEEEEEVKDEPAGSRLPSRS
ncbi:unnamed protein product [Miscanthus lutarioriparius]|uniref:Uncharacterized protein n=1 Tax=Miscanthus lutarioriparius TaxID=422564 RepID=A0A811NPW2_9POAL|nr:unnamed protein product [Miscanthus lutarioriparius]